MISPGPILSGMLLLDNDDIDGLLSVNDCIGAVESAYRDLEAGEAAHRPRATFHVAAGRDQRYTLATMDGVSRRAGYAAIRIRSDFVTRDSVLGRERKYAREPGSYCGLVLLLDISNAAPVAILADGRIQQLRVGATAAAAAKQMAREDARVLAIIGAGGQARSHAAAYATIRNLDLIKVFSLSPDRRNAFAHDVEATTGVPVEIVHDARSAVDGADIVATCTNATQPVLQAAWLKPGAHLSSVRHRHEVGPDVMARVDRTIIHVAPDAVSYEVGTRADADSSLPDASTFTPTPRDVPALVHLLAGRVPGRGGDDEITYFLNNVGTGLQFVALAALAYRRAVEQGRGRELPTEWFLQDISD
jgi:ornithine cyclodeaminase/alanine dehydrogenase-like protein (mu-crystallin family)